MTTLQRMTFDDLMARPDDGYLYELVRGEIVRMPPPKEDHGDIEAALVEAIGRYLDARALELGWQRGQGRLARNRLVGRVVSGEAGVRFSLPDDPDQTRGVDVGYLSVEQVSRPGAAPENRYLPEMPSLVAEVVSRSEKAAYVNDKVNDYLAGGARLVWLLYPTTRTVTVYRHDRTARIIPAGGTLDGGAVLPGFAEDLSNVFL